MKAPRGKCQSNILVYISLSYMWQACMGLLCFKLLVQQQGILPAPQIKNVSSWPTCTKTGLYRNQQKEKVAVVKGMQFKTSASRLLPKSNQLFDTWKCELSSIYKMS